jgi:lipoate-protein ligase A
MDRSNWRLILSAAMTGASNMALDEALLESVSARRKPPTLRLYRWQPACLSLGHAQPVEQADRAQLERRGWHLVRRATGGRAILHVDELTYSITAPIDDALAAGGVLGSYRLLSQGLVAGLRRLGVQADTAPEKALGDADRSNPVCFEVPSAHEITAGGRKLIGSAQLRRVSGVLQHGTLPLQGDLGRVCHALSYKDEAQRAAAAERLRRRAATLEELLGVAISWDLAAAALVEGFQEALGLDFAAGEPEVDELARAAELERLRYGHADWTRRGGARGIPRD